MDQHIGIGMTAQPRVVRNRNAAQHDPVARLECVYVEAGAYARFSRERIAPQKLLSQFEILHGREFDILFGTHHQRDLNPAPFRNSRVIGEIVARFGFGGFMRFEYGVEMKRLRRLCAPQTFAPNRPGDEPRRLRF